MNFATVYLAAGDGEESFWGQLLVLVVLAAAVGIYMLVKSRAGRFKQQAHDELIERLVEHPVSHTPQSQYPSSVIRLPRRNVAKTGHPSSVIRPAGRDLKSGMELLAAGFLVSVVEQTRKADRRVVEMQKMCFTELLRRGRLSALSSAALKIYILDEKAVYGKSIQCQAMSELAGRTQNDTRDTSQSPEFAPHFTHKPAV